jgi:hypothetical protein
MRILHTATRTVQRALELAGGEVARARQRVAVDRTWVCPRWTSSAVIHADPYPPVVPPVHMGRRTPKTPVGTGRTGAQPDATAIARLQGLPASLSRTTAKLQPVGCGRRRGCATGLDARTSRAATRCASGASEPGTGHSKRMPGEIEESAGRGSFPRTLVGWSAGAGRSTAAAVLRPMSAPTAVLR